MRHQKSICTCCCCSGYEMVKERLMCCCIKKSRSDPVSVTRTRLDSIARSRLDSLSSWSRPRTRTWSDALLARYWPIRWLYWPISSVQHITLQDLQPPILLPPGVRAPSPLQCGLADGDQCREASRIWAIRAQYYLWQPIREATPRDPGVKCSNVVNNPSQKRI